MAPVIQAFLIVEIFRFACVMAGCFLAYLGCRLFCLGLYEKQGELKASYGKMSLALRQVGPGVFFALFGVAMACTGFIRKFEVGPAEQSVAAAKTVAANTINPLVAPVCMNQPLQVAKTRPNVISSARHNSAPKRAAQSKSPVRNAPTSNSSDVAPTSLNPEQIKAIEERLKLTNSISKPQ
jgi:hypothetical protein